MGSSTTSNILSDATRVSHKIWIIYRILCQRFHRRKKGGLGLYAVKLKIFLFFHAKHSVRKLRRNVLFFMFAAKQATYGWTYQHQWYQILKNNLITYETIFVNFQTLQYQLYRQCTPCGFRSTIKRRDSQWVSNSRKFLSILLFLFYSRRKKIVSPKNSWWSSQNNVNSGPRKWLINKTRYLSQISSMSRAIIHLSNITCG